ncbi:MAG: hypothetical protein M1834_002531 [Cirrosporium novae-zelandiae]|nr:MAG: hypothetical protein M1834_002531 [Cirrosporium novae-zelandiae]
MINIEGRLIKQLACGRRKAEMTSQEYFAHRFLVHGELSDAPEELDLKPHLRARYLRSKYIQTPIFDAAFGAPAKGPNTNHWWAGRDDVTELTFRDMDHMKSVMTSDHARQKIGPDGRFFADFDAAITLMAVTEPLSISTKIQPPGPNDRLDDATVAFYFVNSAANELDDEGLHGRIGTLLVQAIEKHAEDDVYKVEANIGFTLPEVSWSAHFGGASDLPKFALVYKLFLKDSTSAPVVRKMQKEFEKAAGSSINSGNSFILFGEETLIQDYSRKPYVHFDPSRQRPFTKRGP